LEAEEAEFMPIFLIAYLLLTGTAFWTQVQSQRISLWIAEKLLKNCWHL